MGEPNPNFFVIGAPKSGTTTLASYLRQHPEVLVSTPKETCFHFAEYEKGVNYYRQRYFPGYTGQSVVCDMSVLNMYYCDLTAKRIFHDFPSAKLLALLRDPIERAYSDYRESVLVGLETNRFEKTLDLEEKRKMKTQGQRIAHWMYFSRGKYADQLEEFLRYFPKERVKVMLYEKFFIDPKAGMEEICQFLNINPLSTLNTQIARNVNRSTVHSAHLQRLFRGDHEIGYFIKKLTPKRCREKLSSVAYRLKKLNVKPDKREEIEPEFRQRLAEYYDESNKRLSEMFDQCLACWFS